MYTWDNNNGLQQVYGIVLPKPAPVHSYISKFPALDAIINKGLLWVLDTYNEKLLVYGQNMQLTAESDFNISSINCEPFLSKGTMPAYKGIKLINDQKTGKLYFIEKSKGRPEQLWEIGLTANWEIIGFSQIKTIEFPKYKIQQVYANKIYYMLIQKEKRYICVQEIGFMD